MTYDLGRGSFCLHSIGFVGTCDELFERTKIPCLYVPIWRLMKKKDCAQEFFETELGHERFPGYWGVELRELITANLLHYSNLHCKI